MSKECLWSFPSTGGGKKTGFNESGIQFFKDNTLLSLAREICQNSLDAKLDNDKPVIVEFHTFLLNQKNFLGYEDFLEIIDREILFAKKYYLNDKKPLSFYSEAKRLLEKDSMLCLRISDFNTTGLTGSNRTINSKWDRLVKSEGFSDNPETAGGSFGIGKNAAFACSKLNTVFYSTFDEQNLIASQGVAKLSSCECKNGDIIQGTGYYGRIVENNRSINLERNPKQLFLDNSFKERKESGTDIYILGFDDKNKSEEIKNDKHEGWVIDIAASIIDNYMVSIFDGKMIVKINDLELNKDTLANVFNYIYENNPFLFNTYTKDYFDILVSDKYETYTEKISMFEPDDVEFKLAFDPNFKNRVAVIKGTGMKIFDKDHLPQISFYCGILKLIGRDVNAYFRQMENPKHDEWYPSKMKDEKEARKQYNKLFDEIKRIIREKMEDNIPDSMDAEGVGEYLPDDMDDGSNNEPSENINDDIFEEIEIKEYKNTNEDAYVKEDSDEDDGTGNISSDGEHEASYGQADENKSDGGNGSEGNADNDEVYVEIPSGKSVEVIKGRCFYLNNKYEYCFKSPIDLDNAKLTIEISGETTNYKPTVTSAFSEKKIFSDNNLKYRGNVIEIGKVKKDELRKIQFEINENENWALEVKLYEN